MLTAIRLSVIVLSVVEPLIQPPCFNKCFGGLYSKLLNVVINAMEKFEFLVKLFNECKKKCGCGWDGNLIT
jgi:hypothetical protein